VLAAPANDAKLVRVEGIGAAAPRLLKSPKAGLFNVDAAWRETVQPTSLWRKEVYAFRYLRRTVPKSLSVAAVQA
jgi:hypothetical protein